MFFCENIFKNCALGKDQTSEIIKEIKSKCQE